MIYTFNDDLSAEEANAMREMHRVLENDQIADSEIDLVSWMHSQNIEL